MFYYNVTFKHVYDEDEITILCKSDTEINSNLRIVIEFGSAYIVGKIDKPVDELTVITNRLPAYKVVACVDVSAYEKEKEEIIKKQRLLEVMEEKSKEVKLLDSLRKLADKDPDMKELLRKYEELN